MRASELACQLSSALEGDAGGEVVAVLQQLLALLQGPSSPKDAVAELDEVWMDLHPLLMDAAAQSPAAEAAARALLAAAAAQCTAREVFMLCMATLAQHLSGDSPADPAASGPSSPGFQLCLLASLHQCLPRIRRRPLHFLADVLQMQMRWAGEVLPDLSACSIAGRSSGKDSSRDGSGPVPGSNVQGQQQQQPLTVAAAAEELARLAGSTAEWAHNPDQQLAEQEQQAALHLLGAALLQMASFFLQLPQNLEAGAAALAAAAQQQQQRLGGGTIGAAPAAGSRLPLMRAAAEALAALPTTLLAAVPLLPNDASLPANVAFGAAESIIKGQEAESLQHLADGLDGQLAASGLDPAELSYFSAAEAAEGVALAACLAAISHDSGAPSALQAQRLQQQLPAAACCLLDLGAHHQSTALTLLPLCALCTAGSELAAAAAAGGSPMEAGTAACSNQETSGRQQDEEPGPAAEAAADAAGPVQPAPPGTLLLVSTSAALHALLSGLVAVMSHNPVQLLRSSAHDALHAVLDAFQPAARLAQLRRLMQMPSTAAAVVALQRLRQEMAAAWDRGTRSSTAADAARALPAGTTTIGSSSGVSVVPEGSSQVWLTPAALELAFPCLERGSQAGWHDEASVLAAADVQAAALSLLRWVLLRQRAAAPQQGPVLLPPQRAAALLQADLLPLRACVERLLQAQQAQQGGAWGSSANGTGASGSSSAAEQQQRLDGILATQRLHEALVCVLELLLQVPEAGASGGGGS